MFLFKQNFQTNKPETDELLFCRLIGSNPIEFFASSGISGCLTG